MTRIFKPLTGGDWIVGVVGALQLEVLAARIRTEYELGIRFEPAPYEIFLALLIPAWLISGTPIPRAAGPLIVLMLLFLAGGVLASTQAKDFSTQPIYYAVSAFLAFSSCFFACIELEMIAYPTLRRSI